MCVRMQRLLSHRGSIILCILVDAKSCTLKQFGHCTSEVVAVLGVQLHKQYGS